jgi:hypothetical protein
MVTQCEKDKLDKGYCCDSQDEELKKPLNEEYMEHINNEFKHDIFRKDHNDNFIQGQVPLIKLNKKNGKMESIDICNCGGDKVEYANCIKENCKDFRVPSRYEYCKLGSDINKRYCVNEENNDGNNFRCKLKPIKKGSDKIYSHTTRVGEFVPDCFLNLCNKDPKISKLDDVIPTQTIDFNSHFHLKGNTLQTYKILKEKENKNEINVDNINNDNNLNINNTNKQKPKSLMDYLKY